MADGKPEVLSLRQILEHHIDFQFEVQTRKYQTLLKKEQAKKEIQEGLIKACDVIDLIIEILRGSQNQKQAKACLVTGETEGIRFGKNLPEKQRPVFISQKTRPQPFWKCAVQVDWAGD